MVSKEVEKQAINIAIDGYAGSGKSTLAKALANAIDYRFIDTGALYRAATLILLEHNALDTPDEIGGILEGTDLQFAPTDNHILVNGVDCEEEIRSQHVARKVSEVAAMSEVRNYLLERQRSFIKEKSVVMEGRDIGTVIMPDAELKLFVTARFEVRARRRYEQVRGQANTPDLEAVGHNLRERDRIDSTRETAPLSIADGAVIIDNSDVSFEELLRLCLALVAPLTDSGLLPHMKR